jgi:glycosyltransferase involved in cell wall biosynthesis
VRSQQYAPAAARAPKAHPQQDDESAPDVSVVMPCLNEERSVGVCVERARDGIRRADLTGEVIVCDNGSTDDSVAVATAAGARVVHQAQRGYGAAYRRGFEEARGRYIVMGDSDASYDFSELHRLVELLRDGRCDYVLGSRFAGKILPGAMPWSHRYIGNPVLTGILNRFFHLRASDAHSGMRAFTREAYERMGCRTTGMEFASEIIINAARARLKVGEVPITYHPRIGDSKLHSLRDGWRHLRFMLLLCPKYLFVIPGIVMLLLGVAGQLALLPGPLRLGFHALDMHFSALFALLSIVGYQVVLFGVFANTYARTHRLDQPNRLLDWIDRDLSLEHGLILGVGLLASGLVIDSAILFRWLAGDMGPLNEMRPALLAMTLIVIGLQTIFASFFLGVLRMGVAADREASAEAGRAAPTSTADGGGGA